MNYYIQGNAANADKIKAAFEKLGYDVTGLDMCNDNILFFTYKLEGGGKVISTTNANLYTANIIKTHPGYQELELSVEPKFKVGSWLYHNSNGVHPVLVTDYDERHGYQIQDWSGRYHLSRNLTENEYHLWSMADAKDGDILHHSCTASNGTFIFKGVNESGKIFCYCDYDSEDHFCLGEYHHIPHSPESKFLHPATKEQRELLFAKMKEAGYQWDAEKKELNKIKPRYDIANFHVGMPVLVRDYDNSRWSYVQFSHYVGEECKFKFNACGIPYIQCIPFNEETKHLLGTTDMCPEEYINW